MNKFLLFGMLAVASMLVFATTEMGLGLIQQADAVRCNRNLVAVCGVCVNAAVIAQQVTGRCNQ
jgi:hypothetical protein